MAKPRSRPAPDDVTLPGSGKPRRNNRNERAAYEDAALETYERPNGRPNGDPHAEQETPDDPMPSPDPTTPD